MWLVLAMCGDPGEPIVYFQSNARGLKELRV